MRRKVHVIYVLVNGSCTYANHQGWKKKIVYLKTDWRSFYSRILGVWRQPSYTRRSNSTSYAKLRYRWYTYCSEYYRDNHLTGARLIDYKSVNHMTNESQNQYSHKWLLLNYLLLPTTIVYISPPPPPPCHPYIWSTTVLRDIIRVYVYV